MMNLAEMANALSLHAEAGCTQTEKTITGGIVSDLLSNVMGRAAPGNVWVTMQGHPNIVAVASLMDLAAIIVAGGVQPDEDSVMKASQENVPLFTTTASAFEVVGQLYRLGVTS